MSGRPTDWTPLGFDSDPTPGSSEVLRGVEEDFRRIGRGAREVNAGLDAVLRGAESGGFRGATAEALREEVLDRLKRFIAGVAASFDVADAAVVRYRRAVEWAQDSTASTLAKARGLTPDDPRSGSLHGRAAEEREWLAAAARQLERSLDEAAGMLSQPVEVKSGLLKFLDTALLVTVAVASVVGVFTGGWIALAGWALSAAVFVKSAVDLAQGKGSWAHLGLAVVGVLFPSTKGLGFGWLTAGAKAVMCGGSSAARGIWSGSTAVGRTIVSPTAMAVLLRSGVTVLPELLVGAGSAVFQAIKGLPEAVGRTASAVSSLIDSAGGFVKITWHAGVTAVHGDFVQMTAQTGGTVAKLRTYTVVNAGRAFDLAISAVTPLHYSEIASLGYRGAFHLAFVERGLSMVAVDGHWATSVGAHAAVGASQGAADLAEPGVRGAAARTRSLDAASVPSLGTAARRMAELDRSLGLGRTDSGLLVPADHAAAVPVSRVGSGATDEVRAGGARGDTAAGAHPSPSPSPLSPSAGADVRDAAIDLLAGGGRAGTGDRGGRGVRAVLAWGSDPAGVSGSAATAGWAGRPGGQAALGSAGAPSAAALPRPDRLDAAALDMAGRSKSPSPSPSSSSSSSGFTPVGLHESVRLGAGGPERLRALPAERIVAVGLDTAAEPLRPAASQAAEASRLSGAERGTEAADPPPLTAARPPHTPAEASPASPDDAVPSGSAPHRTPEEFAAKSEQWREFRQARDLRYAEQLDCCSTGLDLDFAGAYARFRHSDLFGGAYLADGNPALKQVREQFHEDVRAVFESGWEESGGIAAAAREIWEGRLAQLRSGLPDRLARASAQARATSGLYRLLDDAMARFAEDDLFDGAYLRDPEKVAEHRAAEQARAGEAVDAVWEQTAGRPAWWREQRLEAAFDELRSRLPQRVREASALRRYLNSGEYEFGQAYGRWQDDLTGGGGLDDAVVDRVRQEFTTDLRVAWQKLSGEQRQAAFEDLTGALPDRFRYAEFRELRLERARQALDEAASSFEEDLVRGGVQLGAGARERLADEWARAVESAVEEYWFSAPGRHRYFRGPATEPPAPTLSPGLSWDDYFQQLTCMLPHRLEHEAALNSVLRRAAADFHQITARPGSPLRPQTPAHRWDVTDEVFETLADGFREETVTEYDRIWGPEGRETEAWLRHEADHENMFGAALNDLQRAQRSAEDTGEPGTGTAAPQLSSRTAAGEHLPRTGPDVSHQRSAPAAEQPPQRDATPQAQPAATEPRPAQQTQTARPQAPGRHRDDGAKLPDRGPVPEAPASSGAERPWYLDLDTLGEVSVVQVDDMQPGLTTKWGNRIADEVTRPGEGELHAEIREGIRRLLMSEAEPGAGRADQAGGTSDPGRTVDFWEKALQQGRLTVAGGHVVWLRPVLRKVTPTPAERIPDVVDYKVAYAKLTSSVNVESAKSSGINSTLQTLLSTSSAAASTVAPVLPVLSADVARSRGMELERDITAGRKVFATEHTRFAGSVHVRVFVDGVERPHGAVTPRQVTVDLPARFSAPDGPRPCGASPSNCREVTGQRSHRAREVVNAIDLIPVTAALQRHLLEAGLPAHGVQEIMSRVLPRLNERSALHRSRYWLTSGVVSDRTRFPVGPGRFFEGHVFMRARIERLQYLGDTSGVAVREDTSGNTATGHTKGVRSRALAGLALLSVGARGNATFIPAASLTGQIRRDARHGLSEGADIHTVLTATSDQARYRAQLRVVVRVRSTTRPQIPAFSHLAESEIAVPARESADFERSLLGGAAPPLRQASGDLEGPVEAQPHVRALLREAGLVLPESAYRRPARLDQPLPAPHPREPLALATRRGQGFAGLLALPGAELVHDQIRGSLERWHNTLSGNSRADWSGTDHDLLTWFGRPALEIDLAQLLTGVDHAVRLGGRSYDVSVRAHLLDRIGGVTGEDAYPMMVNVRSQQTAKVSGRRDIRWNLRVSAGARVGVKVGRWVLAQAGVVRGSAGFGRETRHTLSAAARSYRRSQAAGPVDEHVYDVVYEISVRAAGHPVERWWIDKPKHVVARGVVPHQHVPATPLSAAELAAAGTVSRLTVPPDGPAADFRGGTAGVYPAFLTVPELAETAARMYQEANKLPAVWLVDRANWPTELRAVTDTVHLSAEFGALTGCTGKVVALPVGRGGWKQALRIRIAGHEPRHVAAHTGRSVEVQQYSQGQVYANRRVSGIRECGVQAAAGPQLRIGSGQDNGASTWNPTGMGGAEGAHDLRAQMTAAVSGEVLWQWMTGTTEEQGPIGNSRAAYRGPVHTYRADPVFELTLHRWKGSSLSSPNGGMTRSTACLRVADGVDFLVPERRIFDLGLPVPNGVEHVRPNEPDGYVDPVMLPAVSHAEVLHADGVLDRMRLWLTDQGVLRSSDGDSGAHRPDLLLRELERSFSSDALLSQFSVLSGAGVTRWLPLPWAFGATRYLWTNVTAETGPPVSQLSRPDVRLMTRGQTHHEAGEHDTTYRSAALSAQLRTRIGTSAHGGLELGAGYTRTTGKGFEQVERENDIYRAITEEESQEFEHPLTFRIRMGITSEMPEILSTPARGIGAAALGLAGRLGQRRAVADWWYRNQPFVKRFPAPEHPEDGTVHGRVRLLVPSHLVLHGPPAPAPTSAAGTAVWERHTPRQDAPRSPAGKGRLEQLLEGGHPWALPAASAARRWAALPAAPFQPPRDLAAPNAWHVPGLDFTTLDGLRYSHFTSENILRAGIGKLLRHQYEVPVGEYTVTVGLEVTETRPLTSQDGIPFSALHHKLAEQASKSTLEKTRDWYAEAGPEGGAEFEHGPSLLEQAPATFGVDRTEERMGETAEVQEPDQDRSRRYRHYKADVDLVVNGPRGRLRVHVPNGLYFMLPMSSFRTDPSGPGSSWTC